MKTINKPRYIAAKQGVILRCSWCGREPLSEREVYLDKTYIDSTSLYCMDWQKCNDKIELGLVAQAMERSGRWIRFDKTSLADKYRVYKNLREIQDIGY